MAKYAKEFLDYSELADLAIARGLVVDSKEEFVVLLKKISYYRLSAYWLTFKQHDSDIFEAGTTLKDVLYHYEFDKELRLITFKAIASFEISLRNDILHTLAQRFGRFGYSIKDHLPNLETEEHNKLLKKLSINREKSTEAFIAEYRELHEEEAFLPIWMAVEHYLLDPLQLCIKDLKANQERKLLTDIVLQKQY